MKVLLDTNIVLDVLLTREGFYEQSVQVFAMSERKEIDGFLCATTLTTIFYVLRKSYDNPTCLDVVDRLLKIFNISKVDKNILLLSLKNCGKDFEDSVLYMSAKSDKLDFIITRDKSGFKNSPVKTLTPKEFLQIM